MSRSSEEAHKFESMKKVMICYCNAQITSLNAMKGKITDGDVNETKLKAELDACIASFTAAKTKTENRTPKSSGVTEGMKAVGGVTMIGGAILLGGPVSLGVGCGIIAGGGGLAGVGALIEKAKDKCSTDSMMKPIVEAERKVEKFFQRNETILPEEVKADAKQFKTESANFKKRVALYVIGGLHLAAAAIILGASHGVLAPVALKIALMGAKHISAGMAVTAVASKTVIEAGLVGVAASMSSKRSEGLKQITEAKEGAPTPLLRLKS